VISYSLLRLYFATNSKLRGFTYIYLKYELWYTKIGYTEYIYLVDTGRGELQILAQSWFHLHYWGKQQKKVKTLADSRVVSTVIFQYSGIEEAE
jgi:hypothetical protein